MNSEERAKARRAQFVVYVLGGLIVGTMATYALMEEWIPVWVAALAPFVYGIGMGLTFDSIGKKLAREQEVVGKNLVSYLTHRGVWDRFVKNYDMQHDNQDMSLEEYLEIHAKTTEGIMLAFTWDQTSKGWAYWSQLDRDYRRHMGAIR